MARVQYQEFTSLISENCEASRCFRQPPAPVLIRRMGKSNVHDLYGKDKSKSSGTPRSTGGMQSKNRVVPEDDAQHSSSRQVSPHAQRSADPTQNNAVGHPTGSLSTASGHSSPIRPSSIASTRDVVGPRPSPGQVRDVDYSCLIVDHDNCRCIIMRARNMSTFII